MASKQEPPPVPRINTPPVTISSPNDEYFPDFCTPARSASPVTPAIRSTTPTSLLRTPPVEGQLLSRVRTRNDTNGEASARSAHSSSRATRTASPSGNRSTTLSPSVSSGGGSYHSSDTGRSPCSLSSSDYLTPPQFQVDRDKRPYKARRQSSDSLNMVRKPKRASTMPHDKSHKSRRRHRRRKHRCHREGCHKNQTSDRWHLPGFQVAPTAPKGLKELSIGHVGKYKPQMSIRGNTDTYGRILPRLWSDPAPPLVSRRWSSVEIGSHQIRLASTLPTNSVMSTPTARRPNKDNEHFPPRKLSRPYRSSTFTRGAIDHDIVRTVREKLTFRKVPSTQLQTPTTITLRRASGVSCRSGVSTVTDVLTPANGPITGSTTPHAYPISQADSETDTAYLITSKEIDSITELIEANLRRNFRPHNRISVHPPVTPSSARGNRSPTSSLRSLFPQIASPAFSAVTTTQAKAASSRLQDPLSYLQVTSPSRKNSRSDSRSPSRKSAANEIIWEAEGSPNSPSSIENSDRKRSSTSDNSSIHQETTSVTPHAHDSKSPRLPPPSLDKGDAFDPNNARASISEWSWRLPQAEIPTIVTSSDSESNDINLDSEPPLKATPRTPIRSVASTPDVSKVPTKAKRRVSTRPALTSPEVEDVVFFPPLPTRKTTNDWYSPLPDIGSPPPKSPSPKSLYDEGIDAIGAIPTNLPAPNAQRHPHFSMMDRPVSPTPSIEFDPDYDLRRKSVVKAHPQAPARVGTQASMGSSLGASSGERRRSSIKPGVKRVRTIDNANRPSRAGTWTRNRPPSVCPPPIAASPAEFSDNESTRAGSLLPNERSGPVDRKRHTVSPPLPKMDRAGIFTKITGTVRSALGLDDCEDDIPPKHECDDCAKDPRSRC